MRSLNSPFLTREWLPKQLAMTTQEIQEYIDAVIRSKFEDFTAESGEVMTSAEGDGRFMGKGVRDEIWSTSGGEGYFPRDR